MRGFCEPEIERSFCSVPEPQMQLTKRVDFYQRPCQSVACIFLVAFVILLCEKQLKLLNYEVRIARTQRPPKAMIIFQMDDAKREMQYFHSKNTSEAEMTREQAMESNGTQLDNDRSNGTKLTVVRPMTSSSSSSELFLLNKSQLIVGGVESEIPVQKSIVSRTGLEKDLIKHHDLASFLQDDYCPKISLFGDIEKLLPHAGANATLHWLEGRSKIADRQKQFATNMKQKCGFWFDTMKQWKNDVLNADSFVDIFLAFQERSGIGDRLAGIQAALSYAIAERKQLQVDWFYLNRLLQPSCMIKSHFYNYTAKWKHDQMVFTNVTSLPVEKRNYVFRIKSEKYWKGFRSRGCKQSTFFKCDRKLHLQNSCDIYNRACMMKPTCEKLRQQYNPVSPVHLVGCPLQLLLTFNSNFFLTTFHYRIRETLYEGTLLSLIAHVSKYNLIGIHLRSGDGVLRKDKKAVSAEEVVKEEQEEAEIEAARLSKKEQTLIQHAFLCGDLVKSELFPEDNTLFIFASDNKKLRDEVYQQYTNHSVQILFNPYHIIDSSNLKSKTLKIKKLKEMFSEWIMLYLSDEIITNTAHTFGVSAFSRSARLHSLRSDFYLINDEFKGGRVSATGTTDQLPVCSKKEYGLTGNLKYLARQCNLQ